MAEHPAELLLTVPADMTIRGTGLALDIGGSVLKCVYRTKEDLEEAQKEGTKLAHLRLVSFGRKDLEQGFDYIRQRAHITRVAGDADSKDPITVYSTGVGCTEYGKQISETLNIKLGNLTEFDCFVKSFVYFAERLSRHHLLEPFRDEAVAEPIHSLGGQLKAFLAVQHTDLTQALDVDVMTCASIEKLQACIGRYPAAEQPPVDEPLSQHESDMFPCILAMIGSGNGFMKIEKDGTYKVVDASNRGGKCFAGVGMLLTGCKTFEELIELAAKGNARNLDQYSNELFSSDFKAEGEQDIYTLTTQMDPVLIYCFGKASSGRGDFSREDIAAAWLHVMILDLAQISQLISVTNGVRRIFFCGSFCSIPLVRDLLTREIARRNLAMAAFSQRTDFTYFDFVKPGAHLGALGAYINAMDKFIGKA